MLHFAQHDSTDALWGVNPRKKKHGEHLPTARENLETRPKGTGGEFIT
jgi:hypothetical protein